MPLSTRWLVSFSRWTTALLLGQLLAFLSPSAGAAQVVGVSFGDTLLRPAPGTKLAVPVQVNLTGADAMNVASLQATVTFAPSRFAFDSIKVASSSGFSMTSNTAGAGTGSVTFNVFGSTALPATGAVATVYLTASQTAGGGRVALQVDAAGNEAGQSVLPFIRARSLEVCSAGGGRWGDVNDDQTVNVIDAQQIARFSVGLSVANSALLAGRGDVTADGVVNVIDAQQVARFSVQLSAAPRTNTQQAVVPAVAALSVRGTATLLSGSAAFLQAAPVAADQMELAGCTTATWSSSNAAVATVSASGLVTAVSPGTATITAASGGQTATHVLTVTGIPTPSRRLVAAGREFTCALAATGAAWCFGDNPYGQLGDGTTTRRFTPTLVSGGHTFVSLVAGQYHVCGLKADGSVFCWGRNEQGQLGDSTTTNRSTPVAVAGGLQFVGINAESAGDITCGITARGAAYCWGRNAEGAYGNTTTTTRSSPTLAGGGRTYIAISAGYHTCGLVPGGAAYCWGRGTNGQLGNRAVLTSSTPVMVAGGKVYSDLVTAALQSCARTASGNVDCWGANSAGTLGIGSTSATTAPVPIAGTQLFASLAAGPSHVCGVTATNGLACWGYNLEAQVGDGTRTNVLSPVSVNLTGVQQVSAGHNHSCAVLSTGTMSCWGENRWGQAGREDLVLTPTRVAEIQQQRADAPVPTFTQLTGGYFHGCGLTATGLSWCWGHNGWGELGVAPVGRPVLPTPSTTGLTLRAIEGAGQFTCGLVADSTATCWGANAAGQLGNGTTTGSSSPVVVSGGRKFRMLSSSYIHVCGLDTTGKAWCWGLNNSGQVGDSTLANRTTPTAVSSTLTFRDISVGVNHTCALTEAGAAWCWGSGAAGELGDGRQVASTMPVAATGGFSYAKIETGSGNSCGLMADGRVACWGYSYGPTPLILNTSARFSSLYGFAGHFCALTSLGETYCWGGNNQGQLGTGDTQNRMATPTAIGGSLRFTMLGGAWASPCGVTSTGALYCWGNNAGGEAAQPLPATPQPVTGTVVFRTAP